MCWSRQQQVLECNNTQVLECNNTQVSHLCSSRNSSRYGAQRFVVADCCTVMLVKDLVGMGQTRVRKEFCHDEAQGLGTGAVRAWE